MEWSPQNAMKAYLYYLDTVQICKSNNEEKCSYIEPQCMEFISALAAGKKTKLMMEITTQGITPLTIALAVAAKHTGGKFFCFLINPDHNFKQCKTHIQNYHPDLQHVIQFVSGNVFQVLPLHYNNVDFLVVDGRLEDHLKLIEKINLNPSGSIIFRHSLYSSYGVSLGYVLNQKMGAKCVTLPVGDGVEMARIESKNINNNNKRSKRFHVVFEN